MKMYFFIIELICRTLKWKWHATTIRYVSCYH